MFLHKLNIQYPLHSPVDAGAPVIGAPGADLSKDDILDYLSKDDDAEAEIIPLDDQKKADKDKVKDKKAKEEPEEVDEDKDKGEEDEDNDEEVDPLKELEEDLEEPGEEKLELQQTTSRREILKKYPKIFKDFPGLETAYYREQEFTKLLPTIAEARKAVEDQKILQNFDTDLQAGNTEEVLNAVKKNNPKAFAKIADNYLETLAKVDQPAYLHVLGNMVRHTIQNMLSTARDSQNDVLEQAAVILNQWAFGTSKWTPPSKLVTDDKPDEKDDKVKELESREKKFLRDKFNDVNNEMNTKLAKAFKATIENKIDPKDSMSEYVKKTAVREANEQLESLMSKDARFKSLVDRLWEQAFKNDFDATSMAKLRQAFVSKAQTLLPSIISKCRNEALKGIGKRVRDDDDDSRPEKESKNDGEPRRRTGSNKGEESHQRNDSGKKVPDGMTALEYLMAED